VYSKESILGFVAEDLDGSEDLKDFMEMLSPTEQKELQLPVITGTGTLNDRLRVLVDQHRQLFSKVLRRTAALLPALTLEMPDPFLWDIPANRGMCRPLTSERQAAVNEFLAKMLAADVIEESEAETFSQVHLVPKPPNGFRFTVDYRALNNCTRINAGFPLPNIGELLQRLGQQKATVFGKLDLTHGYWQLELDKASRSKAAFIANNKRYQPKRVFMGLKSAASYFQGHIASTVLGRFVGSICEVYIDDIIIWGKDEDDFLRNCDTIFLQLRKFNLIVNPDKVHLGLPKIEFLGHLLSPYGLTMSEDRIQKVVDFAKPKTVTEMQSFIGVVNYFHRFIPNHALIVHELHEMVKRTHEGERGRDKKYSISKGKNKHLNLLWSREAEAAFENTKKCIFECPTLFFLRDNDKLLVFTDACDYGIGAVCCAERDGLLYPIIFMSHSLSPTEMRWSTYEKEAYAIFRAFKEFALYIRDRQFLLLTDHKNLTLAGSLTSSAKVQRWRMFMQDYDFEVKYIPGEENVAADALSRFVNKNRRIETEEASDVTLGFLQEVKITQEQRDKIKSVHNVEIGHHGVDRTCHLLRRDPWPSMRQHVSIYIKECAICQKLSQRDTRLTTYPFTLSRLRPGELIYLDTIGPLPDSFTGYNTRPYKYIAVFVDAFTRFVTLIPTLTLEAAEAVQMLQNFFSTQTPEAVTTDSGSQFKNEQVTEFLRSIRVKLHHTLPYSKEENGMVERMNKEVMRHLKALVYEKRVRDTWHHYLFAIQRIINNIPCASTGDTPAHLHYGVRAAPDREGTFTVMDTVTGEERATANAQEYNNAQKRYHEVILEIAAAYQREVNNSNVANRTDADRVVYQVGELVLVQPHRGLGNERRPASKLEMQWTGPYRIQAVGGDTLTLQSLIDNKIVDTHSRECKAFCEAQGEDPEPPIVTAGKDVGEVVVDSVIAHRGNANNKAELQFLIHWAAYYNVPDQWEPWDNVKNNEQVINYCLTHRGLKSLVPRRMRGI
jgi:transposase InsO family protein